MSQARKLFVNLPVRDLQRSIDFFARLGFTFNPQFTDENATCMIVSEEAFVMLLVHKRFSDFTDNAIVDAFTHVEGLFSLSCSDRAEVDRLVDIALASGGSPARPPMDLGFMYGWSFRDPDGHHWELVYMDPSALPPQS